MLYIILKSLYNATLYTCFQHDAPSHEIFFPLCSLIAVKHAFVLLKLAHDKFAQDEWLMLFPASPSPSSGE